MKTLAQIKPSAEQLKILTDVKPGVTLIRGSAGSGKTTTAVLRLKQLLGFYASRRKRAEDESPIRVLVLTFNRTLRGYVENLVQSNIKSSDTTTELTLETFGRWSMQVVQPPSLLDGNARDRKITKLVSGWSQGAEFLLDEVDYVLGRYLPSERDAYLDATRVGRGQSPRFQRQERRALLEQVIEPYEEWKRQHNEKDWNDLAVDMAQTQLAEPYDIIIADETQDFSANQIRAIMNHSHADSSLTFLFDSAQRIYARGFTWKEVGITLSQSHKLTTNYRNTVEIARFVQPLLDGMEIDDDGVMPDFSRCKSTGPKPIVLVGKFSGQIARSLQYIRQHVDLNKDSVAFLHPKGGRWFDYLRGELRKANLPFVELTRESEWPQGPENIALSTMYSAKGIEFDYVFIVGFNKEVAMHGDDEDDDIRLRLRRLLAVAIGRARHHVIVGYKPEERSELCDLLDPSTYVEERV